MKQYYCFLERFNNYFNRKIIKFDSLGDYKNASKDFFIPEDANGAMLPFDFNPNDNVMTEIIANDVPFDADYFLLLDADENIVSRWFILEQKRNRQGQWLYTLRRDVISDHIDTLYDAPIFVQKGMLPEDDPMILNSEGMSFNQVKKNEYLLQDKSKSAWIACYLAKSLIASNVPVTVPVDEDPTDYVTLTDIANDLGISEAVLASNINLTPSDNNILKLTQSITLRFLVQGMGFQDWYIENYSSDMSVFNSGSTSSQSPFLSSYLFGGIFYPSVWRSSFTSHSASLLAQMQSILNRNYYLEYNTAYQIIDSYRDKYILYLGRFYKIGITNSGSTLTQNTFVAGNNSAWAQACYDAYNNYNSTSGTIQLNSNEIGIKITLTDVSELNKNYDVDISSGRRVCNNQEFDLVLIPASDIYLQYSGGTIIQAGDLAQKIASALAIKEGTNIYDVQLLPYCPLPDLITSDNLLNIENLTENTDFDYINKTGGGSGKLEIVVGPESTITVVGNHVTYRETIGGHYGIPTGCTFSFSDISSESILGTISNVQVSQDDEDIVIEFDATADVFDDEWNVNCTLEWTTAGDIVVGAVLYASSASFTTQIDFSLTLQDSMKIDSNCDFYRIVSPNYQGSFEFNVAKNGGSVDFFSVYCTYKPYTPFIKVTPNLNYVYGNDYNDNRGLICGGDFSLPRASSAWQQYQLENKNYQNIFNREIQNLDFMQSIEMRNQLISGGVGIFTDTAKGAGAGAYVGGGAGAIIGGMAGAFTSAIGYGVDVDTLARTQRETRQLAIDKFNYQLGNIKALPYTLTKVGAFDISSKIFPILEYYTCTDKEKEALKNKIKYESMTVMRIGTLREFMNFNGEINYFKGELIRNDKIADDPHTLNAIYEEFLKGVYI